MHVIDSFSLFLSERGLINCVTPPSKMLLLENNSKFYANGFIETVNECEQKVQNFLGIYFVFICVKLLKDFISTIKITPCDVSK